MKKSTELLLLRPDQLSTHPRNMRKFYPVDQVKEMAASIAAGNGVLEPLIITKEKKGGKWLVVDGNMRLAGARQLGEKCPLLECKVVDQSEAGQLLSMVIANQVRYDVDPVSEGMHYKALIAEGLTIREISRRTGVYEKRITDRKMLADLEPPVQKLIVENRLPSSPLVAKAFLDLTPAVQNKLAERLAQNASVKIKTILKACDSLLKNRKPPKKMKRPAVELAGSQDMTGTVKDLKKAAEKVCQSCNQYEGELAKVPSPAWALVNHKADDVCNGCDLKDMQKMCGQCPAVELLRKLVKADAHA